MPVRRRFEKISLANPIRMLTSADSPCGISKTWISRDEQRRKPTRRKSSAERSTCAPVGPRLRLVLYIVFGLVALLGANSAIWQYYIFGMGQRADVPELLLSVHVPGASGAGINAGCAIRDFRRASHQKCAWPPESAAVRVGYLLFAISLTLLASGLALMRFDFFAIKDPRLRSPIYWAHVITPLVAVMALHPASISGTTD